MTQVKGNTALKGDEKPVLSITESKKASEQNALEPKNDSKGNKELSVSDLKNRATVIHLLSEKHTSITAKRASLDKFKVKLDSENAVIVVTDATGEEFKSSSPKTIGKLVEFWKEEFDEKIEEIETELRTQYAII